MRAAAEVGKVFPAWAAFRERIRGHLRAVARIDQGTAGTLDAAFATGSLVADGVLLTNRHVVEDLTRGTGALRAGAAVARFGEEHEQARRHHCASSRGAL